MSNIFPVMIAPRWKQAFVAAAIAPNLLCGTLGTAPAKPFANTDWRLPRANPRFDGAWSTIVVVIPPAPFAPLQAQLGTAPTRFDRTWSSNLLESTLAPAVATKPFGQTDWPIPKRAMSSAALRNWQQGMPVNLFGRDTMFGGAGQPLENADWPLWRAVRCAIGEGQRPSLAMLSVTPPAPFVYVDGRLPTAAIYPISLRTWSSALSLLGQDTFFGGPGQPPANLDSRLPRGITPLPQSWSLNLLETTLAPAAAAAPFFGIDRQVFKISAFDRSWSNNLIETTLSQPIGAQSTDVRPAIARRVIGDAAGIPLSLLGTAQPVPFGSADWRLPMSSGRLAPTWTQNLLLTTLFVPPAMPLNLFDTRLPVRRQRSSQNWVSQALNFTPPPIVSPLTNVNPEREIEASENGRLIITFNGLRLTLSTNSRGRLIS